MSLVQFCLGHGLDGRRLLPAFLLELLRSWVSFTEEA